MHAVLLAVELPDQFFEHLAVVGVEAVPDLDIGGGLGADRAGHGGRAQQGCGGEHRLKDHGTRQELRLGLDLLGLGLGLHNIFDQLGDTSNLLFQFKLILVVLSRHGRSLRTPI